MRFRSLNQNCGRTRQLGVSGGVSMLLGTSLGATLCAGALLAGPLARPLHAAPTIGGDENGPQVQILQPGYQDVLKGKTKILIAVRAQKFNPQFVEMFIDDKPATTGPIPISALPSAQYDWDTKLFVDGPHKLTVRVTDTQGFRGWAEVNVFINNDKKIDSLPPSLSWLNVDDYQQLSGKTQIQLQAVDNFGVKWIIVSINPASDPNKKPALRSWLLNRPPYVINFDSTKVQDGMYQLSAKAWDSFEQEGSANPLTIGIVNSPINATTIGEMLQGLRHVNEAAPAPASLKGRAPSNFTVPNPDSEPNTNAASPTKAATSGGTSYGSAASAQASTPKTTVTVRQGAATPRTPLLPSIPPMVVRGQTPQVKPNVELAQSGSSNINGAAPSLSSGAATAAPGSRTAKSQGLDLNGEIKSAVNDDWRTRIARTSSPEIQGDRSVASLADPQLSVAGSSQWTGARTGATSVKMDEAPRLASVRSARPEGISRELTTDGSLSTHRQNPELSVAGGRNLDSHELTLEGAEPTASRIAAPQGEARQIMGAPALSQEESFDASRTSVGSPLKVEAGDTAHEGRLSGPESLLARAETRPVGDPSLSAPATLKGSRIADRVAVLPPADIASLPPSRFGAPQTGSSRPVEALASAPELSAPAQTPQPKVSAKWPVFGKNQTKVAAAAAPEKTRLSALPRPEKSTARGAITAISVSPLEVKTSDAIPAFHQVTRATDLRAVAARYGLPVDVVAACNGWSTDKTLTVGTAVKLPKQLEVAYQGVPVRGDAPSMLVGGTGVTAFRFMFEQAGGKLQWDAKQRRVIARKGDSEVTLTIGSNKAKVGNKDVMMELAAFLFEGRTMVPVRFFEEGLHAQVEWDPQTGRLVVAMAN